MSENTPIDMVKSDFVAMVSHELRGPLTSIQAAVKLVASGIGGPTTPGQQEMLSLALVNIERMGRMVNQLLDYTKIEAGHLDLHRQRTDLVAVVRDVIRSFEPLAAERGLSLILNPAPATIESFLDRDKIVQIFTNLLHNAIKFTPAGSVTVALGLEADDMIAMVSDTGRGIAPQDLPQVFGRFKRFGPAPRSEDKGSGLGLALTKRLVELHGGTIRVDSHPGEGARFTIHLPRLSSEQVFEQEVIRLARRAQESANPLSVAEISLGNWPDLQKSVGAEASLTVLNHLESQLKGALRGDSDFVIQRPGAFWLAVFSATKEEAESILLRVREKVSDDPLARDAGMPVTIQCRLASFPQDSQNPEDLLALLHFPRAGKLASV